MAQLIRIEDNRGGYLNLVEYVLARGVAQSSRNGDTLEVNDMVIELANPTKSIPSGIGRRGYSNALAALEGLQLVAGVTYDDLMVKIAPNTQQFREDDGMFHGGYGRRIGDQMNTIVERLAQDPDTRQAVVTLWDPALDSVGGKRDHPCTVMFNWRIRQGELLMSTFMRSQDVHWGWPYDVVMFSMLQLAMAKYLGVDCGAYTHHAASFHIYTKDVPQLRALTPWNGEDTRIGAVGNGTAESWSDVQLDARALVEAASKGDELEDMTNEEQWFHDVIAKRVAQ